MDFSAKTNILSVASSSQVISSGTIAPFSAISGVLRFILSVGVTRLAPIAARASEKSVLLYATESQVELRLLAARLIFEIFLNMRGIGGRLTIDFFDE